MKLYEGAVFDVERREGLDLVVHAAGVGIVAVDREEHVTLVRQPRLGAGGPLLELPAGMVDPGESRLECARRELQEETGLHGGDWIELASFYTSPGYCNERLHLFLATGLEPGDAAPEATEELEPVRLPLGEVAGLVAEVEDAKTLVGLLLLLRRL